MQLEPPKIGFTGMPTYPAYGVDPLTTAFPEATTARELVASSSAPRWYAADYHHPLPATGAYVDVPGYAALSGLRRGTESCESRSRGSGRQALLVCLPTLPMVWTHPPLRFQRQLLPES